MDVFSGISAPLSQWKVRAPLDALCAPGLDCPTDPVELLSSLAPQSTGVACSTHLARGTGGMGNRFLCSGLPLSTHLEPGTAPTNEMGRIWCGSMGPDCHWGFIARSLFSIAA